MSVKGQRTFRHKGDHADDELDIMPLRRGAGAPRVQLIATEHVNLESACLWFTPAKTRQIAAALNRAADIAEKEKT